MASNDNKLLYDEKNGSPATSAVDEPVTGHVSRLRRRLPGFSLEVRQEESSFAVTARASNADFDPIPPSKRTWNWGAYVAYWMADAWAVSNWEVGEFPATCFVRGVRERGGADNLVAQLLP
jgi:NCS1 family nucleobase:cation symporter-1